MRQGELFNIYAISITHRLDAGGEEFSPGAEGRDEKTEVVGVMVADNDGLIAEAP